MFNENKHINVQVIQMNFIQQFCVQNFSKQENF